MKRSVLTYLLIIPILVTGNLVLAQTGTDLATVTSSKNSETPVGNHSNKQLVSKEKEKAREELPALLQGSFTASRYSNYSVSLTVSASWKQDSLQIVFNFYRGDTASGLNEDNLVESVLYVFKPEDITQFQQEDDEFLFFYLRTSKNKNLIYTKQTRPKEWQYEEDFRRSAGFPVHRDKAEQVQQFLRILQQ
jgi:hypothetical protein